VFDARYRVVEVLARAADLAVGRAAYRAAIIKYPLKRIYLRIGDRVVLRSDRPM
jgi:hypothetical protein